MAIPRISHNAILAAVEEHDRLGAAAFMQKYGFGEPRGYYLQLGGRRYGAKAIVGAAHGHEYPQLGALSWREFSGGKRTVAPVLRRLGFEVVEPGEDRPPVLVTGASYTRDGVADIIGLPAARRRGGSWVTGYDEWNGAFYIFTNVGIAGRTGHDYPNRWDGKLLVWYGKSHAHRGQPQVERLVSNALPVNVFWRCRDRDPFVYSGAGMAVQTSATTPVEVVWSFDGSPGVAQQVGEIGEGAGHARRRGPPPAIGSWAQERMDGPTEVYLLVLEGDDRGAVLVVPPDHVVVKVGISNNLPRRLAELNCGFPPGSAVRWTVLEHRTMPDGYKAWALEGERLRQLQQEGWALGGEFGLVPRSVLADFLRT